MKKLYLGGFILFGMLVMVTACGEEKTTSQSNSAEESSSSKKEDVKATKEKESEEENKTQEEVQTKPSNEEIKEIVQKSYQLLEAAKKNSEDNLARNFDSFVNDLGPYFTTSYIKDLPLEMFSVATSYNLPSNFDFDKHFEVTSNSANQVVAEVYQTDDMNGPVVYIITAKKEDGQWKIDDWTYEEVTDESTNTTSSNTGSTELLDEDAALERIISYFEGYEGLDVPPISLKDEDTYSAEVTVLQGEGEYQHGTVVYVEVNRHTGEVTDVTQEFLFGE